MNYSKDTISKIGNAIVYLADKIPKLSKTKLLKLLYIIEEKSVIQNKTPFFGIDFQVWQAGPVAREIYIELSEKPDLLKNYIKKHIAKDFNGDVAVYITAKSKFNDDEFSDADIALMDTIIEKYGNKSASELVKLMHKKDTAWYCLAEKNDLLIPFQTKQQKASDLYIDFSHYLSGCDSEFYNENLQMHKHFEALKNYV